LTFAVQPSRRLSPATIAGRFINEGLAPSICNGVPARSASDMARQVRLARFTSFSPKPAIMPCHSASESGALATSRKSTCQPAASSSACAFWQVEQWPRPNICNRPAIR
jgi:hypothetical protein